MTQRYQHWTAQERMSLGLCPECGEHPLAHSTDVRFWMRGGGCDLLPVGVEDRIRQYRADVEASVTPCQR